MLLFLNTYSKKFNGLYQMIKSAKNIGFIFVLISITVLTGRFFLNSKNNFINTERTNIERRTIYEKLKPLLDKAKLASDQGDNLKVINILKQINQKINILNESELQKNIYRGKNLNAIAQNYQAIGYFKEAEDSYLKAAKVYLDIPFKENSQYVLENYLYLSNLYSEIEDYDRGIATLLIANNLIEEQIGKKILESYIIAGEIGELYLDKGEFLSAEVFIEAAIKGLEEFNVNHEMKSKYQLELADLYIRQKKYIESEKLLSQLIKKKYYKNPNIFIALSNVLLSQGKFNEAEKIALQLIKENKENYNLKSNPDYPYLIANIAYIYDYQKLFLKSRPYHLSLLNPDYDLSYLDNDFKISILNNVAHNLLSLGSYEEAERLLNFAIEANKIRFSDADEKYIKPLSNLSLLYYLQGRQDESNKYGYQALQKTFESMQKRVQELNILDRQNFISDSYQKFHLFPFAFIEQDSSYKNLAFFSRINYQGLLQDIENRQNRLKILDPEIKQLRNNLKLIESKLSSNKTLNSEKFRKELFSRKIELEKSLNVLLPKLNPIIYDADDIASVIPKDSVLIEYQKYDSAKKEPFKNLKPKEKYLALILSPDGNISSFDLGSAEVIESMIDAATKATKLKTNNALQKWREVSDLIIKPLTEEINQKDRLIISPDSALNKVAYSALGSPLSENLLNDDFQVNLITAGRDLLDINQANSHKSSTPIVIANPDFGKPKSNIRRFKNIKSDFYKRTETEILEYELELKGTSSQSWKSLPFSKLEGQDIKEIIDAQLFMNEEAKASLIFENNISPKIIHIASHSFYHDAYYDSAIEDYNKNPLNRSGIVFAGANLNFENDNDDGFLTALEISRLDLRGTELFVVSGCESAMGDLRIGEGIYGLKRSIAVAGAQSSLLSLWNIRDDSTAIFMTSFYKRLKKGETKSEALYSTQRDFREGKIKSSNPELYDWSKPFYWAPFQLSGDWKSIEL